MPHVSGFTPCTADLERQHVIRIEAGINVTELLQTAQQQPRTGQQDNSQGDLHPDKNPLVGAASTGLRAACRSQGACQFTACPAPGRVKAANQRGRGGATDRVNNHAPVQGDFVYAWKTAGGEMNATQQKRRHAEPEQGTEQRQPGNLRQQLQHQVTT